MTSPELHHLLIHARDHQLSVSTLAALNHLHDGGTAKISSVANVVGVSTAAMTGLADRLISLGLATRTPGTADRRSIWLAITAKGSRLIESALLGPALV